MALPVLSMIFRKPKSTAQNWKGVLKLNMWNSIRLEVFYAVKSVIASPRWLHCALFRDEAIPRISRHCEEMKSLSPVISEAIPRIK